MDIPRQNPVFLKELIFSDSRPESTAQLDLTATVERFASWLVTVRGALTTPLARGREAVDMHEDVLRETVESIRLWIKMEHSGYAIVAELKNEESFEAGAVLSLLVHALLYSSHIPTLYPLLVGLINELIVSCPLAVTALDTPGEYRPKREAELDGWSLAMSSTFKLQGDPLGSRLRTHTPYIHLLLSKLVALSSQDRSVVSDGERYQCVGARHVAVVFSNVSWALGAIIQFGIEHYGRGPIISAIYASAGGHLATLCCQMLSAFLDSDFASINETCSRLDGRSDSASTAAASSAAQGSSDGSVRAMALDTALLVLQALGTTLYWIPHARKEVCKNEEFVARLTSLVDDRVTLIVGAAVSGEGPKAQGTPPDQDMRLAGPGKPDATAAFEATQGASMPEKILIMRQAMAKVLKLIDTRPPAQIEVTEGTNPIRAAASLSGGKSAEATPPASSGAGADDASHFFSVPMGASFGSSSKYCGREGLQAPIDSLGYGGSGSSSTAYGAACGVTPTMPMRGSSSAASASASSGAVSGGSYRCDACARMMPDPLQELRPLPLKKTPAGIAFLMGALNGNSVQLLQGQSPEMRRNTMGWAGSSFYNVARSASQSVPAALELGTGAYEMGLPPGRAPARVRRFDTAGGVAGGQKLIDQENGVFLKTPTSGGMYGSEVMAGKVLKLEAKASKWVHSLDFVGANAAHSIIFDVPYFPVDTEEDAPVAFQRVLAQTALPISGDTIRLGSSDAGVTLHHDGAQDGVASTLADHCWLAPIGQTGCRKLVVHSYTDSPESRAISADWLAAMKRRSVDCYYLEMACFPSNPREQGILDYVLRCSHADVSILYKFCQKKHDTYQIDDVRRDGGTAVPRTPEGWPKCLLPFDVELHTLKEGYQIITDPHRLLIPDQSWIDGMNSGCLHLFQPRVWALVGAAGQEAGGAGAGPSDMGLKTHPPESMCTTESKSASTVHYPQSVDSATSTKAKPGYPFGTASAVSTTSDAYPKLRWDTERTSESASSASAQSLLSPRSPMCRKFCSGESEAEVRVVSGQLQASGRAGSYLYWPIWSPDANRKRGDCMEAKGDLLKAVREWLLACVVDTNASTGSSATDPTEALAIPPVAEATVSGTGRKADPRAEPHAKSRVMPCEVEVEVVDHNRGAGIIFLACSIAESSGRFPVIVSAPAWYWGDRPSLSCLFSPQAAAIARSLRGPEGEQLPRVSPDCLVLKHCADEMALGNLRTVSDALVSDEQLKRVHDELLAINLGPETRPHTLAPLKGAWLRLRSAAKAVFKRSGLCLRHIGLIQDMERRHNLEPVPLETVLACCLPQIESTSGAALARSMRQASRLVTSLQYQELVCMVCLVARAFGSKTVDLSDALLPRALGTQHPYRVIGSEATAMASAAGSDSPSARLLPECAAWDVMLRNCGRLSEYALQPRDPMAGSSFAPADIAGVEQAMSRGHDRFSGDIDGLIDNVKYLATELACAYRSGNMKLESDMLIQIGAACEMHRDLRPLGLRAMLRFASMCLNTGQSGAMLLVSRYMERLGPDFRAIATTAKMLPA